MKRIVAFLKPNMLEDVVFALHEVTDFPGATIAEVQRVTRGPIEHPSLADRKPLHPFQHWVRMEIVCTRRLAEEIVETIRENAHTGLPDDGNIYISSVEDAVSI